MLSADMSIIENNLFILILMILIIQLMKEL